MRPATRSLIRPLVLLVLLAPVTVCGDPSAPSEDLGEVTQPADVEVSPDVLGDGLDPADGLDGPDGADASFDVQPDGSPTPDGVTGPDATPSDVQVGDIEPGPVADPPEPAIDHAGTLLISETIALEPPPGGGFGRTGRRALRFEEHGVLAVTVWAQADPRLSSLEVRVCPELGADCTRLNRIGRDPGLAWLPDRYHHTVETAAPLRLELYLASLDGAEVFVRVAHMPWVEQASSDEDRAGTLTLGSQTAHRGAGPTPTRWYRFDAPRGGLLRLVPQGDTDVVICDPELWGGIPTLCAGQQTSPARRSMRVGAAGPTFVVLRPGRDPGPYRFLAFFDPDPAPSAAPCEPGEHPDGAGACAATGVCALSHHDGGTGRCVPEGTCDPFFELRADGRCEGWLADGPYLGNTLNDELVTLPDGHVVRSGYVSGAGVPTRTLHIREPVARAWRVGPALRPDYNAGHRFCPTADGRVLVVEFDGYVLSLPRRTDRLYALATDTWKELEAPGLVWRRPSCLLLASGRTLVWESGRAALFEPGTETWTPVDGLENAQDPTGIEVRPGLVVSAAYPVSLSSNPPAALALWSESTGSWTPSAPWPDLAARPSRASWLIPQGEGVLVISGESSNGTTTDRIHHYAIDTDTWEARGVLPLAFAPSGVAFDAERALFTWQDGAGTVALYDLAEGSWRALPSLRSPWSSVSRRAVTTPRGDLLVIWDAPVRLHLGR